MEKKSKTGKGRGGARGSGHEGVQMLSSRVISSLSLILVLFADGSL